MLVGRIGCLWRRRRPLPLISVLVRLLFLVASANPITRSGDLSRVALLPIFWSIAEAKWKGNWLIPVASAFHKENGWSSTFLSEICLSKFELFLISSSLEIGLIHCRDRWLPEIPALIVFGKRLLLFGWFKGREGAWNYYYDIILISLSTKKRNTEKRWIRKKLCKEAIHDSSIKNSTLIPELWMIETALRSCS